MTITATFDAALSTLRDHIRLALGDRDTAAPMLDDSTIDAKLAAFAYSEALAQLAEALISEYSQKPNDYSESGGVSVTWDHRIEGWQEIVKSARAGLIPTPSTTKPVPVHAAVGHLEIEGQRPRIRTRPYRIGDRPGHPMDGYRGD